MELACPEDTAQYLYRCNKLPRRWSIRKLIRQGFLPRNPTEEQLEGLEFLNWENEADREYDDEEDAEDEEDDGGESNNGNRAGENENVTSMVADDESEGVVIDFDEEEDKRYREVENFGEAMQDVMEEASLEDTQDAKNKGVDEEVADWMSETPAVETPQDSIAARLLRRKGRTTPHANSAQSSQLKPEQDMSSGSAKRKRDQDDEETDGNNIASAPSRSKTRQRRH